MKTNFILPSGETLYQFDGSALNITPAAGTIVEFDDRQFLVQSVRISLERIGDYRDNRREIHFNIYLMH